MISFKQLGKMGRLGNSLFQIAATISVAMNNNDEYAFPPWEYEQDFNLNCFSSSIQTKNVFKENGFEYKPIPYVPDLDLVGFFQSEKYFENVKPVILGLLTPKIGYGIKWDVTSIHVRRGDYVALTKEYEQLTMDYYRSACNLIQSKHYLIFSDDIAWCKTQFRGNEFEFSEGNSPVQDLSLQLACANNIIANSSFSWWAAYLNKNPSKIVVAPSKWFGKAQPHNTRDLLPKEWISI